MKLVRETQWSREYRDKEGKATFVDSRFRDGSCSITLDELGRKWQSWPKSEKTDFCQSFNHYHGTARAEILRFLMKNGDHDVWQAIAASIAMTLPSDESLPFLYRCCETCELGRGSNFFQALWITKSQDAVGVLRTCLDRLWSSADLMESEKFCNFIVFDAIWCMDALLRLGVAPELLKDRYETLKRHPSMSPQVAKWLSPHFDDAD